MSQINPVIKKILYAAIIVYVIGSCVLLSGIIDRQGKIEHFLSHQGYDSKPHKH